MVDDAQGALQAKMLNKVLFVVFARAVAGVDRSGLRDAHLEYMVGLEGEGSLFAAGPLLSKDQSLSGDGLIVIRASSQAEAERLAADDPYVRQGARTIEVRPWRVMEGSLRLDLRFSQGSFTLS